MATCPECDADIVVDEDDLEEMELGDPWDCEACGSRLRVAGVDPLEFESDDEEDDDEEEAEAKPEGDVEVEDVDDPDADDDDEDDDDKDWDE